LLYEAGLGAERLRVACFNAGCGTAPCRRTLRYYTDQPYQSMAKTAYATTRREADILIWIYDSLRSEYGPQNWWPADSAFEVCVGAILTQAVTWKQVEEAIAALRREALLSPKAILEAPTDQLARLLRPTRYFNQK